MLSASIFELFFGFWNWIPNLHLFSFQVQKVAKMERKLPCILCLGHHTIFIIYICTTSNNLRGVSLMSIAPSSSCFSSSLPELKIGYNSIMHRETGLTFSNFEKYNKRKFQVFVWYNQENSLNSSTLLPESIRFIFM